MCNYLPLFKIVLFNQFYNMILDNENNNLKVHEWIAKNNEEGVLDIVTGYFTVGALVFLAKVTQQNIKEYRFVLGDIVNFEKNPNRALDLLNENISVEAAIKLRRLAKEAVAFLELDKVAAKTLEPNFCHAKLYLKTAQHDDRNHYFISGSSNLTEAGTGMKKNSNIELNLAETGNNGQFKELSLWFTQLWNNPKAHAYKTIQHLDGKTEQKPFKQYLIDEIKKIFVDYTPKELYYKVLWELFGQDLLRENDNLEFSRQMGRLENSTIYNALFEFQQKGVLSLIKMLQKYNGAILADAVGLGKTWSALAVMKFYELQGREVILICPKKLQHNWLKYKKDQNSKFEKDEFDYFMRFHTDMSEGLMEKYKDRADSLFVNKKPKLFVIDESHNLRNDKSKRYQFLVEEILAKNEDIKVLMLSATPINNSLMDIRNQFKLIVAGKNDGFKETLDIKNIDSTFRIAQKEFNKWIENPKPKIAHFVRNLNANFFHLTDNLTVARTRKMIQGQQDGLDFPTKAKPENIFVTPRKIGNFDDFDELFNRFPPMLSGYQPAYYTESAEDRKKRIEAKKKGEKSTISILEDELQRDRFLVKMMYILLVKRLESSWFSFQSTITKIQEHHQNALNKIDDYEKTKKDSVITDNAEQIDKEMAAKLEGFSLGKKRPIKLSVIEKAGNLRAYKQDLKKDIEALDLLKTNLAKFEEKLKVEVKKPNNYQSEDEKLTALIDRINAKRQKGANNNNPKVIIFTVYKGTAFYLYDQLRARGFDKIAAVSGDASKVSDEATETKFFEPILERFAPFTKLFKEKEWTFSPSSPDLPISKQFDEWQIWTAEHDKKTHQKLLKPIDILIATDTLSEGQNLQDCDLVINYDIHWNPVRVIQRMGRIDRLGSPNSQIFGINFWPSDNINAYLNLQGRIEQRMATMKLAGSEVHLEFSDTFREMAEDENLEQKQNARMLEQMQASWEEIDGEATLGFDNFSLERFRQDLSEELKAKQRYYESMPKGVYTGFIAQPDVCTQEGIIALMGYPTKPPKALSHQYKGHELIYINYEGKAVLLNQKEILEALAKHKNENRSVPKPIDNGEPEAIKPLTNAIEAWLKSQTVEEQVQEDGTVKQTMGKAALDMLNKLRMGSKAALDALKTEGNPSAKFTKENFDLIVWFVVNK
jgi:ERCC4-related helicase